MKFDLVIRRQEITKEYFYNFFSSINVNQNLIYNRENAFLDRMFQHTRMKIKLQMSKLKGLKILYGRETARFVSFRQLRLISIHQSLIDSLSRLI